MTLVPYLLVAAYACKIAYTGETYGGDAGGRRGDGVRGAIATVYAAGMLYAGGAKFILLAALLYAPGTSLYFFARREQRQLVVERLSRRRIGPGRVQHEIDQCRDNDDEEHASNDGPRRFHRSPPFLRMLSSSRSM